MTAWHFYHPRRDRTTTAFADETDFLDFDGQLTPPSELYAGSGGKPPLSFHMDAKSHKKKWVKMTCWWQIIINTVYDYVVMRPLPLNQLCGNRAQTYIANVQNAYLLLMMLIFCWPLFSRSNSGLQQPLLVSESVQDTSTEWLEYVDPNEPRYCLCNQVYMHVHANTCIYMCISEWT